MSTAPSPELMTRARSGDRGAFDLLFSEHVPKLRGVLRKMVGHPDDVDELAQQSLLRAFEGMSSFQGASSPGTWLCSIGARLAIDHLRERKRWRERAQVIYAARAQESEALGLEVGAALMDAEFSYDVNEHIAYCFTCVGRTLEPESQAALVLRDVLDLSNEEAAKALGLSHSVLRHRLTAARQTMQESFEGLCALVNKQGACWQCQGLRDAAPEGHRGPEVPAAVDWPRRLQIVREAVLDGRAHALHDVFFRHTEVQEQARLGNEDAVTMCGQPDAESK